MRPALWIFLHFYACATQTTRLRLTRENYASKFLSKLRISKITYFSKKCLSSNIFGPMLIPNGELINCQKSAHRFVFHRRLVINKGWHIVCFRYFPRVDNETKVTSNRPCVALGACPNADATRAMCLYQSCPALNLASCQWQAPYIVHNCSQEI